MGLETSKRLKLSVCLHDLEYEYSILLSISANSPKVVIFTYSKSIGKNQHEFTEDLTDTNKNSIFLLKRKAKWKFCNLFF